jgi:hypothetical protein
MRDVVIIVPMLGRPHRVQPLVDSITEATPCAHRILFVATKGDEAVIDAVTGTGCDLEIAPGRSVGDYAAKINIGYQRSTEPFIFTGACDLHFHPGWFEAAVRHFADPAVGVVGTQDLANRRVLAGEHSTHSLVSRSYVDRFGTIDRKGQVLHEGYPHCFVDDELVGTAKSRGAFRFEHDSIVQHFHPNFGTAEMDATYEKSNKSMRAGALIYRKRSRLWTSR